MVEATAQARIESRRSASISTRRQLGSLSVGTDIVALVGSMLIADAFLGTLASGTVSVALYVPTIVLTLVSIPLFYAAGLYELEAYVSRPLHLWTLLKTAAISFGLSGLALYIIQPGALDQWRFALILAFGIFILLDGILRLGVLDRLTVVWMRQRRSVSLIVGESKTSSLLAERLSDLRGFEHVERVKLASARDDLASALDNALERYPAKSGRLAAVFVDVASMEPDEAYYAATTAQKLGAEVYMASGLLDAADGGMLLSKLFDTPMVRLLQRNTRQNPYVLKRAFDVVGSGILLMIAAPIIAVLGIIIKVTSPGPVFYSQTRVGRDGKEFQFLKLRSMVVNDDASIHEDYVKEFMKGNADRVDNGDEAIFKKVDDPRITRIGHFIRKFSLDELPQFWNVFRGDMSLVGPRPALPYEVAEYDGFDRLRMRVPAGITGLWQVKGRSRVTFDEMILQDLVYAQNSRLLVDIELCLSTIPAALLGGGGG